MVHPLRVPASNLDRRVIRCRLSRSERFVPRVRRTVSSRNLAILAVSAMTLVIAAACSSDSAVPSAESTSAAAATGTSQATAERATPEPELQLVYPGLVLNLSPGDFWDFEWQWSETNCAQGSGCRTGSDQGLFRIELGSLRQIGGIDFFAVSVLGVHLADGGAVDLAPTWAYLGVDGPLLLGSDGRTSVTLFDARTGEVGRQRLLLPVWRS